MPNADDTEIEINRTLIELSATAPKLDLTKQPAALELLTRALLREFIPTRKDQQFPESTPETTADLSQKITQRCKDVFEYLELVYNKPDPDIAGAHVLCAAILMCVPEAVTYIKIPRLATHHMGTYDRASYALQLSNAIIDTQIGAGKTIHVDPSIMIKMSPDARTLITLSAIIEALEYKQAMKSPSLKRNFMERGAKLAQYGALLRNTASSLADFFYEITPVKDPKISRGHFNKVKSERPPVTLVKPGAEVVRFSDFADKRKGKKKPEKPQNPRLS